jgi:hypothetical protein
VLSGTAGAEMADVYTVRGRLTRAEGGAAEGFRAIAIAHARLAMFTEDGLATTRDETVRAGEAPSGADGSFSFTFDWDAIKPRARAGEEVSAPKVSLNVLELAADVLVASAPKRSAVFHVFTFDIALLPVSIVAWQFHYPPGISRYGLGDTAVLSAVVSNNVQRNIARFGLSLLVTAIRLDDPLANAYVDRAEPFPVDVGIETELAPAGTAQTGETRYEPNPLTRKPIAIAFQIPTRITIVNAEIPSGSYSFAPSGDYQVDATLLVDERVAATARFQITVTPARPAAAVTAIRGVEASLGDG